MWSVSIKSLLANKFRLALTSLAIVFGVGFVVASFVLSDSLQSSFGTLSRELVGGTDLVVRPLDEFGTETSVDDGLLTQVREVDGVRAAHGTLDDDMIQPIKPDGTTVTLNGPPQIGTYWTPDVDLNRLKLVEGTEPSPGGS